MKLASLFEARVDKSSVGSAHLLTHADVVENEFVRKTAVSEVIVHISPVFNEAEVDTLSQETTHWGAYARIAVGSRDTLLGRPASGVSIGHPNSIHGRVLSIGASEVGRQIIDLVGLLDVFHSDSERVSVSTCCPMLEHTSLNVLQSDFASTRGELKLFVFVLEILGLVT